MPLPRQDAPERDWTVGPGQVIAEFLYENKPTCPDAAALAGRSRFLTAAQVESVLSGGPLTPHIAKGFHEATGISFAFWVTHEANYRNDLAAGRKDTR